MARFCSPAAMPSSARYRNYLCDAQWTVVRRVPMAAHLKSRLIREQRESRYFNAADLLQCHACTTRDALASSQGTGQVFLAIANLKLSNSAGEAAGRDTIQVHTAGTTAKSRRDVLNVFAMHHLSAAPCSHSTESLAHSTSARKRPNLGLMGPCSR